MTLLALMIAWALGVLAGAHWQVRRRGGIETLRSEIRRLRTANRVLVSDRRALQHRLQRATNERDAARATRAHQATHTTASHLALVPPPVSSTPREGAHP